MYDFISGVLAHIGADHVVVAAGGIGYRLAVPATTLARLRTQQDDEVTLYTSLLVSETCQRLFGFASREERELFLLFQSVNGVGPSLALALLGAGPLDRLLGALRQGDTDPLILVKGVGRKMAQRLCLELKEKVSGFAASTSGAASPMADLARALQALGYSRVEALVAAERAVKAMPGEGDTSALLKTALKESRTGS